MAGIGEYTVYMIEEREAKPKGMPWSRCWSFDPLTFETYQEAMRERKILAGNCPWYRYRIVKVVEDDSRQEKERAQETR